MRYSLRTKLSFSYVLIIVICVLVVIALSNALLETQFQNYVITQQRHNAQGVVSQIAQRFGATGDWDTAYIEDVGMNALENGLILKVTDINGAVVWDAATHNNGMCQQMLTNMSRNMQSRYSQWEGGYEESEYDLNINGQKIGTASVGYYGPFFYTDSDLYFIDTINSLIIWAGVASVVFAIVLGFMMSRQLSRPISRVIDKAQMIAHGFYGNRINEQSKTKEIRSLVDTVNNLADTLNAQQMMSRQTSMDIAHELRTPLTTVQGNLEAVMDGVMALDEARLKVLYEQIMRINRLVDDLAELAQFENKNFELNITEFDLSELLKGIVVHQQNDFANENKSLQYEGQSLHFAADRDKLSQVMVNLLSNARKYTRPGDSVSVALKEQKNSVQITVSDTGIGISETDLPHIFERFYRSDKSRSRKTGGAGIGLAIVKSIVLAHSGSIKVSSKPSQGTEFIITLPKHYE